MEQNKEIQLICRICLSKKENMKDIYNLADVLMTCAPIQIEKGDGLPSTICLECEDLLNQAHEFQLLCKQSDEILRKKFIKVEPGCIKTDRFDDKNECSDDDNGGEFKVEDSICSNNEDVDDEKSLLERKSQTIKRKKRFIKTSEKVNLENNVEESTSCSDKDNSDECEKSVGGKELQCKYCDMKFRYKVRLRNHEQKHIHGLNCHLCDKHFSTLKQLTNHINIHSRKGAHLCQICGKQFTLPENLVRHQRIHNGIRPYKCQLCNKSFTQSNELKSHFVTHTAEKNHLCSICGNKYSRPISLRVHIRRMHSIPANHRPYICTVCGRNFKDRRDLSQHMQIHTGERSHICKICNKAFNRSSNLRVHERIHSGHKPHVCPVCHRAFIQKHVLITHMRTHPPYNSPPVEVKMGIDIEDAAK